MARQLYRNKSVPHKCKAESNKSDNDYIFPEVVDNATGNDPPDENAAAKDSKEEERYAARNLSQGPK